MEIKRKYQTTGLGESLFPDSGILEFSGAETVIKLPAIDATRPFKVRLVNNTLLFPITEDILHSRYEYRTVSYNFGEKYAETVVEKGGV